MRAHWYRGERGRNFGDALMPVLFERLARRRLEWSAPQLAQLFGIGSIGHRIPEGFEGYVWGTGLMFESQSMSLRYARVLALRGPLSARSSGVDAGVYADPGLLAGRLIRGRRRPRYRLSVVPHYADDALELRVRGAHRVNILAGVDHVLDDIARSERIVTSSLHAMIAADSLGVPSTWSPSASVLGDGFKFRDYAASFGEELAPRVERLADQSEVRSKQEQLLELMREIT
jgi:pyruvyltransferase